MENTGGNQTTSQGKLLQWTGLNARMNIRSWKQVR